MLQNDERLAKKREVMRRYYQRHKLVILERNKKWQEQNKEKANEIVRKWYVKNKEKVNLSQKAYRAKNKESEADRTKTWRLNNLERARSTARLWGRKKYREDVNAKLARIIRGRTREALLSYDLKRGRSCLEGLGCSISELRVRIETQFTAEMAWDNWGSVWELDHVTPLARFDLSDELQLGYATHHSNLQPLLKSINRKKSCKLMM